MKSSSWIYKVFFKQKNALDEQANQIADMNDDVIPDSMTSIEGLGEDEICVIQSSIDQLQAKYDDVISRYLNQEKQFC